MEFKPHPNEKEGAKFIFNGETFHRAFKQGDIATLFDNDGGCTPCFTTSTGFKNWVGWNQLYKIK
tara:strand:+ start:236 stop:430 length:195 start_codon:yes stop_codon:yes gene_type:complete